MIVTITVASTIETNNNNRDNNGNVNGNDDNNVCNTGSINVRQRPIGPLGHSTRQMRIGFATSSQIHLAITRDNATKISLITMVLAPLVVRNKTTHTPRR